MKKTLKKKKKTKNTPNIFRKKKKESCCIHEIRTRYYKKARGPGTHPALGLREVGDFRIIICDPQRITAPKKEVSH